MKSQSLNAYLFAFPIAAHDITSVSNCVCTISNKTQLNGQEKLQIPKEICSSTLHASSKIEISGTIRICGQDKNNICGQNSQTF